MTPDAQTPAPPLTVIICCHNSEATLGPTLEAVARQEYDGWYEVLVIDNGSTDRTASVAERFADRFPSFRVLDVPSPGSQPRALNTGIREAKSEILVFLDSDDEVAAGYLRHMAAALETAPFVGASMDVDKLNAPELRRRRPPLQVDHIDTYCRFRPAVVGAAMGARRAPVEEVGGFDEDLDTQHDLDISWRLYAAGIAPTFVPGATLHYRYRTTARATFKQEFGYGVGEAFLYRKYRGEGMPRPGVVRTGAAYARGLWTLLTVWRPGGTVRLATIFGMNLGRIRGSLKHRVLYL